jgi:PAS domain S-box-containing protein
MNILLGQIRALALFALLWGTWFYAAAGGPLGAPSTTGKTVLVLYGERLSIPAMRMMEQGLTAGLSSAQGWNLEDFSEIGRKTAALALRVLAGEKLPVLSAPDPAANPLLINWPALKKWHVSESRIPGEATVLYREPSLWEQHPRLILATAATLALQSLLIVWFTVQRSKWKRAEQSLRESEERMNLAAEAADLGIWVWDIRHGVIWATEKCRLLFGFEPSERLDFQRFIDRVHPEDRKPTREAALRLLLTRREFDTEYRLLLPDSDVRWIATRGHGIFDNQNRPMRLLGVSIDITARKHAHLQFQQQRDELAHLSRVTTLGEMATALAHELNQPLGAILSNAEAAEILLQKNPPDLDELRAILKDIREDGWRAGEVIRRMRSLLKRQKFKMERIEVKSLVEALDGLLQAVVISRKARLQIEVAPALPPVLGDAVHLQQVLLNLILNALEAMVDCTTREREVVVRAVPSATSGVEITVTDRGPGFSKEKLARLFEPFFTTKKDGMGIGLAICHKIIDAHGGRLQAENNPDRGATVRFTLPKNHYTKGGSA